MTAEPKMIKLTKKGLPDRRAETSKINMLNAQKKAAHMIHAIKEKNVKDFVSESEDDTSSDDYEEDEVEPEEEAPKPKKKLKTRDMVRELNDKIEKLIPQPPKVEVVPEVPVEVVLTKEPLKPMKVSRLKF